MAVRSSPSRRDLLRCGAAAALAPVAAHLLENPAMAQPGAAELPLGPAEPFDFSRLETLARDLAAQPYVAPPVRFPEVLETINYDAYKELTYRPERALWQEPGKPYPIQFFHLGRLFQAPIEVHVVEGGQARQVLYDPAAFRYGDTGLEGQLPDDLGYAGFRLMNPDRPRTDWLVFLGAAYFRSSGELDQYGLSARGIAIDTALPTGEEFPRFSAFWLEPSAPGDHSVAIHALLDGPSITGAFRIDARRDGAVVMTVKSVLFARTDIKRMGVAPLTSMFWYAENDRRLANDWRPEIHDSDGLAVWTGNGERLWRPLINPATVRTNSFLDHNPRGFGLMQRDRDFANYQDDGAFYNRRPSLWVEPLGDWGAGAVQLVEIPTDDEIYDNIVAYWVPAEPVLSGSRWEFDYRLYWSADHPYPSPYLARTVATRQGWGGTPGQPRPPGRRKFVIDFAGGPLDDRRSDDSMKIVAEASRGTIDNPYTLPIVGTKKWRAVFDLDAPGPEPVDLRCSLRHGGEPQTETWIYQYLPPPA